MVIGFILVSYHYKSDRKQAKKREMFQEEITVHGEWVYPWLAPPWRRVIPTGKVIKVPGDVPSISEAIGVAPDGAEILVSPGRYRENLVIMCRDLVVRSEEGPRNTIIDGGGKGATLAIMPGESNRLVLTGFTITGGTGMLDPYYEGEKKQGGGIYIKGCSPVITWNVIENNTGQNGGGILCHDNANALIVSNLIRGNKADKGGGIRISNSSPVIMSCVIIGNSARKLGGGLYWRRTSIPHIANNTIIYNDAGTQGGGVFGSNLPKQRRWVVLANNIISGNKAPLGPSMAVNQSPTQVGLVANILEGGEESIYLAQRGVSVTWEKSNFQVNEPVASDGYNPAPDFPGHGMGIPEWSGPIRHDFLGNRFETGLVSDTPSSVNIGAVGNAEPTPEARAFWPEYPLKMQESNF